MGPIRFVLALAVLAVASPAGAQEPERSADRYISTLPASLRVPTNVVSKADEAPRDTSKAKKRKSTSCNSNGCGYKALLGGLVITRDIQASDQVSVRMLPTSHSVGGDDASTPILLRPRVHGSGDAYSLNLRAKF